MAKNDKLGKLLLGSALAGAAIGTLTYFLKKKGQDSSWDDEDLEDFDDNLTDHKTEDDEDDDDTPVSREYVTIHTDHSHAGKAEGASGFRGRGRSSLKAEEKLRLRLSRTRPKKHPKLRKKQRLRLKRPKRLLRLKKRLKLLKRLFSPRKHPKLRLKRQRLPHPTKPMLPKLNKTNL